MPGGEPENTILVLYALRKEGEGPTDSSDVTGVLCVKVVPEESELRAQIRRFDYGPLPKAEAKREIVQDAVRQAVDVHFALDKFYDCCVANSPNLPPASEAIQ
jgi:hypothetical protein